MLKYTFLVCLLAFSFFAFGTPRVPSNYEFAGMKLTITDGARKQIQTDVDALHRNQSYLSRRIEKVDMYFPIIERVFREENLPDDFKYLVIQESALKSDAISSSYAVGFWQFKEASAKEVGLRVDRAIDERMHITASSHAAAKYLKKNNFFFDNWVYALLAYNTGPGGAEQHINKKYLGKKKMEISKRTHWYVKKFLAHKIAFENEIHKNNEPNTILYEYSKTQGKSLSELSSYFEIEQKLIKDYNKWLKRGRIPTDKEYLAIIPVSSSDLVAKNLLGTGTAMASLDKPKTKTFFQNEYKPVSEFDFDKNQEFPRINNAISTKIKVNGIPGFIALNTDDLNSIVIGHGISESKFLKFNDMTSSDEILAGQVYYLKAKKSKAKIHYHVVIAGENAWSISQKYGIKVNKLLEKNRMREEKDLSPGMVMWLRFIRPRDVPVEYKESKAQNVIVKSIPNEIPYPDNLSSANEEVAPNPVINDNRQKHENEPEEFLFEELNEETEYINENSFVDLNSNPQPSENEVSNEDDSDVERNNIKNREKYHIVTSGETLFSIARSYGISIGELRQWNNIDDLDILNIGRRLLIRNYSESPKESIKEPTITIQYKTYRVKVDDTLYGIARQHNISIKELMELNNKDDFVIKVGEELKIK